MNRLLIIDRGIPGAGKTHFANSLKTLCKCEVRVFSEDDYWTHQDGSYHYDAVTTKEAFRAMHINIRKALCAAVLQDVSDYVIVMSTAMLSIDAELAYSEFAGLFRIARAFDFDVIPLIHQRDMSLPPSVHDVSEAEMARFRKQFELDAEVILPR